MDNPWHLFRAGGIDWLIVSLEFGPRDKVLTWAGEIIKAHPHHKVILNTHAYLYSDNNHMDHSRGHKWFPQGHGVGKETGDNSVNDGKMIWKKLVSQYSSILRVFSGHV